MRAQNYTACTKSRFSHLISLSTLMLRCYLRNEHLEVSARARGIMWESTPASQLAQ
jgi:hypothetical protein